jgi:hypothetical protein
VAPVTISKINTLEISIISSSRDLSIISSCGGGYVYECDGDTGAADGGCHRAGGGHSGGYGSFPAATISAASTEIMFLKLFRFFIGVIPPNSASDRGFSTMFLQYAGRTRVHIGAPGAPHRSCLIFVNTF